MIKTIISAISTWADRRFAKKTWADSVLAKKSDVVNADWDCNDENDKSYIKNRIAYKETVTFRGSGTINGVGYHHYDSRIVVDDLIAVKLNAMKECCGKIRISFTFLGEEINEVASFSPDTNLLFSIPSCSVSCVCNDSTYGSYFYFWISGTRNELGDTIDAEFEFDYYWIDDNYLGKYVTGADLPNKLGGYMLSENPTATGTLSLNRKPNTTIGMLSVAIGSYTTASGHYSHAIGSDTTASGDYSHAEGFRTTASGGYSHAEGGDTTASGTYSHAEGSSTKSSGYCSHAEGSSTKSSGYCSHAEGNYTTASGDCSHAEGNHTNAGGDYSHAEGNYTNAGGDYSHSDGYYTIAQRKFQNAHGEYNIADETGTTSTRGDYVTIVGNGTSTSARSNAHTLDWSGNAWFAGDVYVGSTGGKNKDAGSVKLAKTTDLHSHSNKTVLDGITESKVSAWDGKQDALVAGENISITGNVISSLVDATQVEYIGKIFNEEEVMSIEQSLDKSYKEIWIRECHFPNTNGSTGWVAISINDSQIANVFSGVAENGTNKEVYSLTHVKFGELPSGKYAAIECATFRSTNSTSANTALSSVFGMNGASTTKEFDEQINSVKLYGYQTGVLGTGSYIELWGIEA